METRRLFAVTGELSENRAGFCQCHEHLFISRGKSAEVNPALLLDSVEKTCEELRRYDAAGGGTVIDAQPVGCNRMPEALLKASQETGVSILASTGFHKMSFYPDNHWIFSAEEAALSKLFLAELTQGMYTDCDSAFPVRQTAVRAGLIKTALDCEGLTPQYEKLFRAAVCASRNADRALMVHVEVGSDPLALLEFLFAAGMPPERIVLCHTDRACGDSVRRKLLDSGVFLEMDTIGRYKYHSDAREVEIFQELLDAGYREQLLFSLDTTRARMKSYTPGAIGLDYILEIFLPMLRRAGVSKTDLYDISHENCLRAFGG